MVPSTTQTCLPPRLCMLLFGTRQTVKGELQDLDKILKLVIFTQACYCKMAMCGGIDYLPFGNWTYRSSPTGRPLKVGSQAWWKMLSGGGSSPHPSSTTLRDQMDLPSSQGPITGCCAGRCWLTPDGTTPPCSFSQVGPCLPGMSERAGSSRDAAGLATAIISEPLPKAVILTFKLFNSLQAICPHRLMVESK